MWDFSISNAFGAMVRTMPYLVVRMLVYFGIALLYIVATGGGGAIGYGFTSFGDGEGAGAFWGALIGFGRDRRADPRHPGDVSERRYGRP